MPTLEFIMRDYIGVRLSHGDRWLIWADDTMQWEVYDRKAHWGRRGMPLVLRTEDFAEALLKFAEGLTKREQGEPSS